MRAGWGSIVIDFGVQFATVPDVPKCRHLILPSAAWWIAALLLCATGCQRDSAAREARERNLRRAKAAVQAQDISAAIHWGERAVARRPNSGLAHRELGLLYDNWQQDYVRALYHYQRYLELRPDAADHADVADRMAHCRTALAAEVAATPAEMKRAIQTRDSRITALETELAALRADAATSAKPPRGKPSAAKAAPAAPPATTAPVAPPPAAAETQTHVVQSGETLATISARYYGSPAKWELIFNANRDRLSSPNNVRVGTRLTIPPP